MIKGESMSDLFDPETETEPAKAAPELTAVAKKHFEPATGITQEERLMELIFTAGNIDVLDRYTALKERTEARLAKQHFNENFALMQKDLVPVEKTRPVKDRSGKILYYYAAIEDLIKANGKTINDHGFSWRFNHETIKEGEVRSHCVISGYGHEEDTYFDADIEPANNFSSASKQRAGAATFADRYAFKGGFGITVYGEDDETPEEVTDLEDKLRPMLEEMSQQTTVDALMVCHRKHFNSLKNDKAGQARLIAVKNDLIKRLSP